MQPSARPSASDAFDFFTEHKADDDATDTPAPHGTDHDNEESTSASQSGDLAHPPVPVNSPDLHGIELAPRPTIKLPAGWWPSYCASLKSVSSVGDFSYTRLPGSFGRRMGLDRVPAKSYSDTADTLYYSSD